MPETTVPIAASPPPPHPCKELLLGFLLGEVSREERRAVMRHLLTGCPECVAITRPVWTRVAEACRPRSGRKARG